MIYLLRHSIDNNSRKGGWSKSRLTKEGRKLAKQTAQSIQTLHFTKIICSDLLRTKQTCKIINKILKLPVVYTNELREFNPGVVSGMKYQKVNKLYPITEDDYKNMDFKYPKGETLGNFKTRIINYYNDQMKFQNNVLYITHRNVISVLHSHLTQSEWNFVDNKTYTIKHCSLFSVDNDIMENITLQ